MLGGFRPLPYKWYGVFRHMFCMAKGLSISKSGQGVARLEEASTGTRLNWPAKPCFRYLALTKHLSFPGIYPLLTLVDASLILSSQRRSVNTYILYGRGPLPAESQNKRQPSVNRVYIYTNVQVL